MKIRLLSIAARDLERARDFYDRQGEGLGNYFLDTLFSDIDSLALFGGVHNKFRGYHRLISKRFPFAVYYKINGAEVEIWRVLDCRQDPKRTNRQLRVD